MKVVAFVPIKLNSERLPRKNILPLGEHRLCYYIFETLKKAGIEDIFVFCSDEKIKKYIPSYVKFLKRDSRLDKNETTGLEIYKEFVKQLDQEVDVYVLAHTTSPFLKAESIKKGLRAIEKGYDSALSVQEIRTFAWYKGKPLNYNLDNIPRTQDINSIYIETSGFFIYKKEVIDQNRRIGMSPFFVEVDSFEAIDIDTKEDFEFAEKIMHSRQYEDLLSA
jgi:CMP-N-acetylneuraminic acid synthetase